MTGAPNYRYSHMAYKLMYMNVLSRRMFLVKYGVCFSVVSNLLAFEQYCAIPIPDDRVLYYWVGTGTISSVNQTPPLRLISIEKHNSSCILRINIYTRGSDINQFFFSSDNGQAWQLYDSSEIQHTGVSHFENLNINEPYSLISNNARTLFWHDVNNIEILASMDEGKSWKKSAIHSSIQNIIEKINLVSKSLHDDNQIYAWIRFSDKDKGEGIYRIDERTGICSKVTDEIRDIPYLFHYMVESRANPKILIGITRFDQVNDTPQEIVISKDGGATWNKTKHNIIPNVVYRNSNNNNVSTIRKSPYTQEWSIAPGRRVLQIESDPDDQDTFYAVTWAGVFVTHNLGESFRLLPISIEYLNSVSAIAINPVDGRHIFAVVKNEDLYHSDDRGCTWKKLTLPKI